MRVFAVCLLALSGCAGDSSGDAEGDDGGLEVPTSEAELTDWLEDGEYAGWPAEAAPHMSDAAHFGDVRTFVNEPLRDSLLAGNEAHPVGSVAVKELYDDGTEVLGWAVMVKTQSDGGGAAWYWYERINDTQLSEGQGVESCVNCHSDAGVDFVRSVGPFD